MKKTSWRIKILNKAGVISIITIMVLSTMAVMANTQEDEHIITFTHSRIYDVFNDDYPRPLGEETIRFDDGTTYTAIGLTNDGTFEAAIRITPDELASYEGFELIAVQFFHAVNDSIGLEHSGNVKIYDAGTASSPGSIIVEEPYTVNGEDWMRIDITAPISLDINKDLWISIEITHVAGEYPIGADPGPAVPTKGDWVKTGGTWEELTDYNLNHNWNIVAIVNGTQPLKANANGPYSGMVAEDIQFTGSASGGTPPYASWKWEFGDSAESTEQNPKHKYSADGTYTVNLTVTDSDNNENKVSTTATVENPPPEEAEIKINNVAGGLGKISFDIENTGDVDAEDINWSISVKGGILGRINITSEDDIDEIEAEDSETVSTDGFIMGFGKVEIKIIVESGNADKEKKTLDGFVFGMFVTGIK